MMKARAICSSLLFFLLLLFVMSREDRNRIARPPIELPDAFDSSGGTELKVECAVPSGTFTVGALAGPRNKFRG